MWDEVSQKWWLLVCGQIGELAIILQFFVHFGSHKSTGIRFEWLASSLEYASLIQLEEILDIFTLVQAILFYPLEGSQFIVFLNPARLKILFLPNLNKYILVVFLYGDGSKFAFLREFLGGQTTFRFYFAEAFE